MRPRSLAVFAAVALAAAGATRASAQPLVCPPVAAVAGRPCETFHFHVQMFRPDTRDFTELYGINQFASATACDRAREEQVRHNVAVVEFFHAQRRDWWQADRFGQCHCDMTVEKASPNFLTDAARAQQIHDANEILQRVRERMLDAKLPADSEQIRKLFAPVSSTPIIDGPKLVPMPSPVAASNVPNSPDDLQVTKAVDTTPASTSSLDLPLADIAMPGITPSAEIVAAAPAPPPAPVPQPAASGPADTPQQPAAAAQPASQPAPPAAQPAAQPAPQPAAQPPAPAPPSAPAAVAADEPDLPAPEDVADAFISYESQRIQNVLKVSGSSQVLDACTQRIQLLSNLRSLIVGSGAKSRLVTAANNAKKESDRLAVVAKLFGSDVPPHWAPKDASDVIFDPGVTEPEKVLRDATSPNEQKRHALYALLASSSPTEQQQLFLNSVIEVLLQ
jgi:hypothetical protein